MKLLFHVFLLLVVSFWSVRALFIPGYFPMHDDTQVSRVIVMGKALLDGQFPVRWVDDLGYGFGYPLYNFYGPLPYYFGGTLYALGVTPITATKLMFGMGIIAAGLTMFFLGRRLFGATGGLLAAALFVYAPYHAVDIYVRGAVGEYWAIAWLPLVVAGVLFICRQPKRHWPVIIGGMGLALVILSHTILGFITIILLGIGLALYWLVRFFTGSFRFPLFTLHLKLILLGLGLSAFFWIPAISEMKFTNVASQVSETADFHDHFVCLSQLWDSPWGYGGSARGCLDGVSFKLGKLAIALMFISLIGWFINRKKSAWRSFPLILVGTGVSVFFLLPISQHVWEFMPQFSYVQYPWRFLSFVIVGVSVMGAYVVLLVSRKIPRIVIVATIILLLLWTNNKLFQPHFTYPIQSTQLEDIDDLRLRVSKISDEYLPVDFVKPIFREEVAQDVVSGISIDKIERQVEKSQYIKFFVTNATTSVLKLNRVYFPGWHYYLNEKEVTPQIVDGIPYLAIPEGRFAVELKWLDTPVRSVANVVSLITVGILLYVYGRKTIT